MMPLLLLLRRRAEEANNSNPNPTTMSTTSASPKHHQDLLAPVVLMVVIDWGTAVMRSAVVLLKIDTQLMMGQPLISISLVRQTTSLVFALHSVSFLTYSINR